MEIICVGDEIKVKVNGYLVNQARSSVSGAERSPCNPKERRSNFVKSACENLGQTLAFRNNNADCAGFTGKTSRRLFFGSSCIYRHHVLESTDVVSINNAR